MIPSKFDKSLIADVKTQQTFLKIRQAKNPELNLQVPSVLDALTYWHTLRVGNYQLADTSDYCTTYFRHFNLDPKRHDSWSVVPYVFVGGSGRPNLDYSGADSDEVARLSVG